MDRSEIRAEIQKALDKELGGLAPKVHEVWNPMRTVTLQVPEALRESDGELWPALYEQVLQRRVFPWVKIHCQYEDYYEDVETGEPGTFRVYFPISDETPGWYKGLVG